ncbi:MAG: gliding motility-associated C-terminal domain-containing protein [bacterium]|nr:gliding motility-associated C-terminal domain-containing protein [bacterium]
MITRKLLLVFGLLFILNASRGLRAQNNCIAIAINEYCASNIPGNGLPDAFGELSDWVELKCNYSSSVSLSGYYLSNDRNNLYKWKFPSNFVMNKDEHKLIWLSGRNTVKTVGGQQEYHASFTLEQCKNQWIILSTSTGVIRDSIFVRPTKGGHSWGRIDCYNTGAAAFRLYMDAAKSPGGPNGSIYYLGYAPTPKLYGSVTTQTQNGTSGLFTPETQLAYFRLSGRTYDTASTCYDIFYTEDGTYPQPPNPPGSAPVAPTKRYIDSLTPITIAKTEVVRFLSVARTRPGCPPSSDFQPSFCESNTYFIDATHQDFDTSFAVISLSMDDLGWFPAGGTYASTVHVEYYDKKKQISEGYAQINRPIQESWLTKQKGFYISIDDRFGSGCNFEGDIFNVAGLGTTPRRKFPTLHLKGGDLESHSTPLALSTNTSFGTAIRDVFIQSIAAKNNLHVNPLHIKPAIAFINGEYVGVYDFREVYDKYYENYYNGQAMDSLDLNLVHLQEGNVTYWDGTQSSTIYNDWKTGVYDLIINNPMNESPGKVNSKYKLAMDRLDKASFIDYMILNSFAQNSDLWKFNVAFGRGHDLTKPGYKWHYYLWNMPTSFNYTAVGNPGATIYNNPAASPCYIHSSVYGIQTKAYDGHGNILALLMGNYVGKPTWGNDNFKLEYKNRYQDLMNGPLKCENLLKQYEYVVSLFQKEMYCHEDPACQPLGDYQTQVGLWDTNTAVLRRSLQNRCYTLENQFGKGNCYGQAGPYDLTVDVRPAGAGKVKVNTTVLETYKWSGKYYQTTMSFKAISNSTVYAFHHWEITGPNSKDPLSMDSIGVNFNVAGDLVAVFTDVRNGITGSGEDANVPTGFTPNGDGINEDFRPLGSAEYATEYQMTVWNRWGQEVFRSVDPMKGWDGNYKGQQAQTGVYAYVITYKNIYNENKTVKGNVTLTR